MPSSDLHALYRTRPITLWVEDAFTSIYLNEAWNGSPEITLAIAGSCSHMYPLVEDARARFPGLPVYALRDRDFGVSNRPKWKPQTMVFVTEAFEAENWTLDIDAFESSRNINTASLRASEIADRFAECARGMVSWLACCATIRDIRTDLLAEFPAHPNAAEIPDTRKANEFILKNPWWSRTVPSSLSSNWVGSRLARHEEIFRANLEEKTHLANFAGKELLRALLSVAWKGNWPPTLMEDAAREIAREQARRGCLPKEVTQLREVLLAARVFEAARPVAASDR